MSNWRTREPFNTLRDLLEVALDKLPPPHDDAEPPRSPAPTAAPQPPPVGTELARVFAPNGLGDEAIDQLWCWVEDTYRTGVTSAQEGDWLVVYAAR